PFAEGTRVFITLPDGSIQRFSFAPQPVGDSGSSVTPYFRPDSDVTSTLDLEGQDSLALVHSSRRSDGSYVTANTGEDYVPYHLGGYFVLRTQAGLSYEYDPLTGKLTSIHDDSGRGVVIDPAQNLTGSPDATSKQVIRATDGGQQIIVLRKNGHIVDIL